MMVELGRARPLGGRRGMGAKDPLGALLRALKHQPTGRISAPVASPPQPRAVFVLHRLELRKGGLTKAWLGRVRLFAAGGWDVHLALISPDPAIDETLRVLRRENRIPQSVFVHHFWRERQGLLRRAVNNLSNRNHSQLVAAWLDRIAGPQGALVFADSPLSYPLLARMNNPGVARVYVIHLAHLSAAATRLPTREQIANGPMTKRFTKVSDRTIRKADRIVVLTDAQKEDFLLRWGADLPVRVIPHCAEQVQIPADNHYDPRLVVVLGRLDYFKRWDDAIRTMALVIRELPDARLRIYGRGEDRQRLQEAAEKLGIAGSVTFAGYTPDPVAALASAACVISTTRREALPMAQLETLAVGTPIVVYDIRYGPREIVRDGIDGFVVPARDIAAAAAAVIRLLTEPDLRGRMSQSAREVTSRFDCQAHDRAWLDLGKGLYEQKVSGGPRGGTRGRD